VAGKESAEAEKESTCPNHGTGAEVQLRLDFTSTAEKSFASSYSTKHFADHCYWAVYVHHASRPAVRYATEVSSDLYRSARHSKVISSATERRVGTRTDER
jgi:hypothetical protein